MDHSDVLSEYGIRQDGRKPQEFRSISCRINVFSQATGSAYFEIGNTKVLAAVYGPHEISESKKNVATGNKGYVNCHFSMSTFSTPERKNRPRGDHRSQEINANLQEIFESMINLQDYDNSQFDIYVEAIQADGSLFAAAVNAASLAVISAGVSTRDMVSACSLGFYNDLFLVDTNQFEENQQTVTQMSLALLAQTQQSVAIETSGRISVEKLREMSDACRKGCSYVLDLMRKVTREQVEQIYV